MNWRLQAPQWYGRFLNDPAWRGQCLCRLVSPVFTPLSEASVYAAWRAQCLSRLAGQVMMPLGEASVYAA